MGVCKEKRKHKRTKKALHLAIKILGKYCDCPYEFEPDKDGSFMELINCDNCNEENVTKCWKYYLYQEVGK